MKYHLVAKMLVLLSKSDGSMGGVILSESDGFMMGEAP